MNVDHNIPEQKLKTARAFGRFSTFVTRIAGKPISMILAFLLVLVWGISGPLFNFSNEWQLVINTGTTIITFLMVFIIQQSQNRDTAAIHLKLNELIATSERASNRLVDTEDLTEDELMILKKFYVELSDRAEKENDLHSSHSLDDVDDYHNRKLKSRNKERKEPVH